MPDPDKPSPQRKGRAAVVIAAIVAAMAVAMFIGFNLSHSTEPDTSPAPQTTAPRP